MTEARARERERPADAWFGAPREGEVPVRAAAAGRAAAAQGQEIPADRRWLRRIGRVLRDAVLAVAIMALVPVGLVGFSKGAVWQRNAYLSNPRLKLRQANPVRPFAPAKDARITAVQAGHALAALQPAPGRHFTSAFVLRPVSDRVRIPWKNVTIAPDMFPTARPTSWNGPSNLGVLEAAA